MLPLNRLLKNGLLLLVTICCFTTTAEAAKKKADPTIFVAPFSSQSTQEYQWVSDAMAMALDVRLFQTTKINYLSLRQVMSSIKNDNIDRSELHVPDKMAYLGRNLGADYGVVGSFTAAWPDISFVIRIINIKDTNVAHTFSVSGHLDDLVKLEADIATHIAEFGVLSKMPTKEGKFGTKKLYAWREEILAQQILMAQSLAPNRSIILPEEAIKQALQHLQNAIAIDADFASAQANIAICQVLLKDISQADISLEAARSASKNDPDTALAGYFTKWQQRQDGMALAELTAIIDKHPGFLLARSYKGELLQELGRYEEAVTHFRAYVEQVPNQVWAMSQIGYSLSKLQRYDEAIEITRQAVDLQSTSPSLLVELAGRYIDAKKYMEAEANLKSAIQRFPQFALAYVRLSFVYLQLSQFDYAKQYAEKAIKMATGVQQHKERAYARLNLANYYLINNDISMAADTLQLAFKDGLINIDQLKNDNRCANALTSPQLASTLALFK